MRLKVSLLGHTEWARFFYRPKNLNTGCNFIDQLHQKTKPKSVFEPPKNVWCVAVAVWTVTLSLEASTETAPTFLYGAAHEEGRTLDSIRRELGYFKPNSSGNQWIGGPKADILPLKPNSGPAQATPAKGVVVIGSTKWVDNYNVPLLSADIGAVRRIAKRVSGRGGGLPSVQAMALAHGEGIIEVACNLLDPSKVGGDRVQEEVERLAREEGISVGRGYFTDYSQEEIIQKYLMLGPIV